MMVLEEVEVPGVLVVMCVAKAIRSVAVMIVVPIVAAMAEMSEDVLVVTVIAKEEVMISSLLYSLS